MLQRKGLLIVVLACLVGAVAGVSLLLWPEPDNWTEEAKACISDKYAGFWQDNGKYSFKMDFENACDRKVACAIDVSVNGAAGSVKDHSIVQFDPRGQTPSARSYALPVKSAGGMAQAARSCRFV